MTPSLSHNTRNHRATWSLDMKKLLIPLLGLYFACSAVAGIPLREDTASQIVPIGPYVDDTGAPLTGLTIPNTDIKLSKNGASYASKNSGGCTHDVAGMYLCTFDATDTSTPGRLHLVSAVSGALVVKQDFDVFTPAVYDRDYASTSTGYVSESAGIKRAGTAQSATGTTLVIDSAAAFGDDTLIGNLVWACGSTQGYCQERTIRDNVGSTDTVTVDAWAVTPSGTITYILWGTAPNIGDVLTASDMRTALGLASADLDTQLAALQSDTDNIQTRLPTALVTGRMDASVDDTGMEAGAVTAIQLGLASTQNLITGTCDSGSTTTCVDDALTQAAASQLEDRLICFEDSFCALITTFTPGTDTATTTKVAPSTRASKAYTIFPTTLE